MRLLIPLVTWALPLSSPAAISLSPEDPTSDGASTPPPHAITCSFTGFHPPATPVEPSPTDTDTLARSPHYEAESFESDFVSPASSDVETELEKFDFTDSAGIAEAIPPRPFVITALTIPIAYPEPVLIGASGIFSFALSTESACNHPSAYTEIAEHLQVPEPGSALIAGLFATGLLQRRRFVDR